MQYGHRTPRSTVTIGGACASTSVPAASANENSGAFHFFFDARTDAPEAINSAIARCILSALAPLTDLNVMCSLRPSCRLCWAKDHATWHWLLGLEDLSERH